MNLSRDFTLKELTRTDVRGIDNTPTSDVVENLKNLCTKVLQPVRDHFHKPITPHSGYRSLEVNRQIGSKDTSQHILGEAVDFEIKGLDNYDVACWIRDNLDFDQLILEYHVPGDPSSGWVHVSYVRDGVYRNYGNRKECLTINNMGRIKGLVR